MKRKLTAAILPVCLILLVFILCGMGLRMYELQGRVSELNTRIAFLEYKLSPHFEFIEITSDIDPAEADESTFPFDIEEMEKIRDRVGSYLKKKYPDKVIDNRSPDADR